MSDDIFALIDADDVAGLEALLGHDPGAASAIDEQGLSALMRAAYRGRGAAFEAIRSADPPLGTWDRLLVGETVGLPAPDAWSADGFTPLHIAAFSHNAGAAGELLDAGADPDVVATASFARVTPLGTAAAFGANEVAAILLDRGAGADITADHGFTPLHAAASNGNTELVRLLIAHGARSDAVAEDGKTPADVATDEEIRELLATP